MKLINFLKHWSSKRSPTHYYILSAILIVISIFIIQNGRLTLINFLIVIILGGSSAYLYLLANNVGKNALGETQNISTKGDKQAPGNHVASTEGGNYNESIYGNYVHSIHGNYVQGNYIEVQGHDIKIDQDLSEIIIQLQEILDHLKTEGFSSEDAKRQVVDDLVEQVYNNVGFRDTLFQWEKSLNKISKNKTPRHSDESTAAKTVVNYASSQPVQGNYSIPVKEERYRRLDKLLRDKQWREADIETARLITELTGNKFQSFYYLCGRDIASIDSEHLRFINNLWIRYSNNRFGFSVQKKIWQEVCKDHETFGERVGWRVEDEWIYQADLTYSLKAPVGHLPMAAMLPTLTFSSTLCDETFSLLPTFMKRIYRNDL